MHKIYESKGDFDLLYQLPITIYSYLITAIFNAPLGYLALSNDSILKIKEYKSYKIIMKAKILNRILTIKFICYFIISFLFLLMKYNNQNMTFYHIVKPNHKINR